MPTTMENQSDAALGLRDFIKEQENRVALFVGLMLGDSPECEEVILQTFKSLGHYFYQPTDKKSSAWERAGEKIGLRIRLFSLAWKEIQQRSALQSRASHPLFLAAKSPFKTPSPAATFTDVNLLDEQQYQSLAPLPLRSEVIRHRLIPLDLELRAPMVLKDRIHLTDEEILPILGLRWRVYRHRLHRGRMEFKDRLKGSSATQAISTDNALIETPMGNAPERK